MASSKYLRVDERSDADHSLRTAARISSKLARRPADWKWEIIALHSALQGALVCVLAGSNGLNILDNQSRANMMKYYHARQSNPDIEMPKEKMASLTILYERAKTPKWMKEFDGREISTSDEQDKDVELINELRNGFIHFRPSGWSIELAGLPRMASSIVSIIEQLLEHPRSKLILNVNSLTKSISKINKNLAGL